MALMNDQSFSIHDKIPICELNSDQLSTYDGYYKQSKSFRDRGLILISPLVNFID
jgi:hypothetical protein